MTILRGALPADHFTIISNAWLRDPALSWKAKGLLAYIASHAPGHALTSEQIAAEGVDSRDSIRTGLVELERRGYLVRTKLRGPGGRVIGTDYTLGDPSGAGETGAGKPVAGDDQAKHDVSAGQDNNGFPGAGEPAGKKTTPPDGGEKKTREKTGGASPRGHRLPEDWVPSPALLQWFVTELVPGERWSEESRSACRRENAKFVNHFLSASGQNARKIDWDRAWKKWMLTAFEGRAYERRRAAGAGPAGQPQTFKQMDRADEQVKLDRARMIDAALALIQEKCPEMEWQAAYDLARQEVDNHLAGHPNGLSERSATGYIEAEVIEPDAVVKEVTGS